MLCQQKVYKPNKARRVYIFLSTRPPLHFSPGARKTTLSLKSKSTFDSKNPVGGGMRCLSNKNKQKINLDGIKITIWCSYL